MIGAKLSDQRNSRNAGRFKSTNQHLAYRGSSPPRFFRRSNPPEEAKLWAAVTAKNTNVANNSESIETA